MANSTNCANLKHGYNSSAEGYIPGKLPLPDDFFPVPQLSAKENKYLLGLAKHACKEVVYYSRQDDGPMKWLHLSSEDGVDVFQGVDNSGTSDMQQDAKALTYLRGSCKIHATIDEISDFFKLDTPKSYQVLHKPVIHPMYDESMIILENRHHSIDENEYYLENEDANGLADMEEAKRMNREFEEMLKKTSDEFNASRIQEERRFNTNAKSLLGMNSASGETLPVDTPLGASDLAPWEEQNKEDDMEDDDELGLPPQYAIEQCDPPTRPRAHGFVRSESGDSLRLSSEHGEEYYGTGAIGRIGPDGLTSFRSNNSGRGVSRSELSDDGRSRSRSRSSHEFRHIPRRREAGFRSRHDSEERDAFESQRRTQQYFDARNALLSGGQHRHTVDFEPTMAARFRSSGIGAGSDPPVRRQLAGSELESPYTSLSDSNIAGAFTTRRRHRSDDLEDRNDEAFRLAMSAMRLYEEERGPSLHVTEETRQAALAKMMEVYAREIERSHSHDAPYSRGTISDTRRLHHDVGIPPPLRRTVSDDRPPSIYGSPLQVFRHDELFPTPRRQRRPNSKKHRREDTYAPSLPTKERKQKSEDTHEYRDLSDLTSSAFQAFQMNSLGPRDAPKLPVDVVESSEDSDSKHEDTQPPAQFQRESTSTTHVQLKSDTSGAAYGSMESNEVSNMISRPNSMYGVASDTFSDMDFTDLPHLMRKDDVDGARSSFTDLQHWTEEPSENGGVEYAPEPRLSDLLSPLHLEDVQHVDDDDSESQSSNSSSQIDWQSSMSNQYQGTQGRARGTDSESSFVRTYSISRQNEAEAYSDLTNTNNGLSESMVTQNDPPQRQYSKPPSLSELLSEYCDSERSSLPSYLEFGGSQPELEPEYLEAIANATTGNQNTIPMEGGRRGHVRRRSSIPSELEAMTSRELFL
ncbi:Kinesin protein [Phytophthora nicotianae]|uniref:Kinesin protein n=1 Tax=Phytophthora nicotianae TaxID=4792 RepID=A0A0W8DU76_PHYNI|nr:Kinesin protein [Phytophthora nicotianae]